MNLDEMGRVKRGGEKYPEVRRGLEERKRGWVWFGRLRLRLRMRMRMTMTNDDERLMEWMNLESRYSTVALLW